MESEYAQGDRTNTSAAIDNITSTPFPTSNIVEIDIFLGMVCVLCIVIGVPGNIVTFAHFVRQKKDLPTILYLLISFNDLLTTVTMLPIAVSFVNHRKAIIYGVHAICHWWGLIWTIIPFISVFLVAILSITRSIVLVKPLIVIRKYVVFAVIGVYYLYISLRVLIPSAMDETDFIYSEPDLYCWDGDSSAGSWYFYYDLATGLLQLAAPIIPIFVSCVISTVTLLKSNRQVLGAYIGQGIKNKRGKMFHSRFLSKKVDATITILLVTAVYIVFNVPIFVAWVMYIFSGMNVPKTNTFMYWYLWSLAYVVCVGANSAVNPIVLYWRNRTFRESVNPLEPRPTAQLLPHILNVEYQATCSTLTHRSPAVLKRSRTAVLLDN